MSLRIAEPSAMTIIAAASAAVVIPVIVIITAATRRSFALAPAFSGRLRMTARISVPSATFVVVITTTATVAAIVVVARESPHAITISFRISHRLRLLFISSPVWRHRSHFITGLPVLHPVHIDMACTMKNFVARHRSVKPSSGVHLLPNVLLEHADMSVLMNRFGHCDQALVAGRFEVLDLAAGVNNREVTQILVLDLLG